MEEQHVVHHTFVIERSYKRTHESVFAAFADASKKRRWFAEGESHTVESFSMDFQVGGKERAHYRFGPGTPFEGTLLENDGTYQDIVLNRRIVNASTMALGGKRISASLTTFEFQPTAEGTKLIFTHQGAFFEGADGPEIREAGWRSLFKKLAGVLDCQLW